MKELKEEQCGKMAEKQTEIEAMTTEINTLREALRESDSKLSNSHALGEHPSQSNAGQASSSDRVENDIERRKVVRVAKDRMLEGYVPSAGLFDKHENDDEPNPRRVPSARGPKITAEITNSQVGRPPGWPRANACNRF